MIVIKDLKKSFGEKEIFSNFNLNIESGEFLIVIGESGSGKTTLLNMIGGIETVDGGSIYVDNIDITKLKNKRKYFGETIGFLFQNFVLLENKTVQQNLSMINNKSEIGIDKALSLVGMSDKKKHMVYTLSGGEQQRIALARLMIKKCSLILADEPTGSLDKKNKFVVMNILKQLNSMGKTIIMVTHDDDLIHEGKRVLKL